MLHSKACRTVEKTTVFWMYAFNLCGIWRPSETTFFTNNHTITLRRNLFLEGRGRCCINNWRSKRLRVRVLMKKPSRSTRAPSQRKYWLNKILSLHNQTQVRSYLLIQWIWASSSLWFKTLESWRNSSLFSKILWLAKWTSTLYLHPPKRRSWHK